MHSNRFWVYSTLIILAFACVGYILLLQRRAVPLAILPLGRPLAEIPFEEFQITNHSNNKLMVRFKTMIKTNGNWTWWNAFESCSITSWGSDPHTSHKEGALIPYGGERWRLVAICTRPATRLSITIENICKAIRIRADWVRTFLVMGPERNLASRDEFSIEPQKLGRPKMQTHFENTEDIPLIQAAAQRGDTDAQFGLAGRYFAGNGVEKSVPNALRWFETAATNRHAEAAYNLGTIYEYGLGTSSDQRQAADWYRLASKLGHSGAQEKLQVSSDSEK